MAGNRKRLRPKHASPETNKKKMNRRNAQADVQKES